jgi:protein-disulfide isomerase
MSVSMDSLKSPWFIVAALAVVLFGGSFWYSSMVSERNNDGIEIRENIKGSNDAVVTLTEYSDFQCPACASFQPALADVMEQFAGQVKLEYKHFPLPIHTLAIPAARAAEAAGQQGQFFEYHDLLFINQSAWSNSANPTVNFIQYATELGLDVDLFKRHMNSSILRDKVRDEFNEARGLGLTGTPTFFLNGERMTITTYEDFINQIAAAVNPGTVGTSEESAPAVQFGI